MRTRTVLAVLPLLLASAALHAQAVRGTFVDHDTGEPVAGGHVVLRDPAGREAASANTGADGTFEIHAPAAGTYTLRGERIGFATTTSAALALGPGETVRYRLVGGAARVMLAAITVQAAGQRCETRPGDGQQTGVVWGEARKALVNAQATAQARLYQYTAERTRRELEPHTRVVQTARVDTMRGMSGNPFVTVPHERLSREGYVVTDGDSLDFRAPDAAALLSDDFLDQHCFRLVAPPAGHEGEIGLAFQPVRDRRLPDVAGTLWLDRQTAELRRMEYGYTNAPLRTADEAGGEMDFRRLPNGSWIVSRWRIRMPLVTAAAPDAKRAGSSPLDVARAPAYRLLAYAEQGGEVTAIYTRNGAPVSVTAGAQLAGVVFDSTLALPVRGARVRLEGTQYTVDADSAGRYAFRDLPDGAYSVSFASARLDSLHFAPAPVRVSLTRGATTRQDLAVPGMRSVLAAGCGDSASAGGMLVGVVRADSGGAPVVGARVTASWQASGGVPTGERTALADYRGVYRICGAPADVPVAVRLASGGTGISVSDLRLSAGSPMLRDFIVPSPLMASAVLSSATSTASPIHVRVLGADGQPVAGATVRLGSALAPQTTDARGGATFPRVAAGTYAVTVAHPRLGTRTVAAVLGGDGPEMELRMGGAESSLVAVVRSPVRLAAIRATAARGGLQRVGYEDRKKQGIGFFMDGDALERHHGAPLSTAMRGVPGVRVVLWNPPSLRNVSFPPEHRILPSRGASLGVPLGTGAQRDTADHRHTSESGAAEDIRGAQCFLAVFLDGVMIQDGSQRVGQDIDANILDDIAAIEVYSGASRVPPQYRLSMNGCGAVLLWTKVDDARNDRTAAR
ncbi:MAG TPA: carboxypeptidase-like regulatory domain-containing protein [Longimicrobiaceae bacterium]|jgi:hypothetical protein|nr:carboxypeptidase-like regulatory domain-containing protein [Longimicrobiaceae bacterium]